MQSPEMILNLLDRWNSKSCPDSIDGKRFLCSQMQKWSTYSKTKNGDEEKDIRNGWEGEEKIKQSKIAFLEMQFAQFF